MREFFTRLFSDPATVRKYLAALFGFIGVAIAQGLLPESWSAWVTVIVSFLSTLGVYGVPNKADPNPHIYTYPETSTERGAINVLELLVIVLVIVLILVVVGVL